MNNHFRFHSLKNHSKGTPPGGGSFLGVFCDFYAVFKFLFVLQFFRNLTYLQPFPAQVNYIEEKANNPREADSKLSEDPDILNLREALKVSCAKAVKRVAKA